MYAFFGIAVAMLVLDFFYLSARSDFHNKFFYSVQQSPLIIRYIPAAIVYFLMAVIVYLYAVKDANGTIDAAYRGALIGFLIYAFYDFTNYATLTNWTLQMTLTDALWGTILCGSAAAVGYLVKKRFSN